MHDEIDTECAERYALNVAACVQRRMQEAMRWGGVVDLPVDEAGASPEKLLVTCWADK